MGKFTKDKRDIYYRKAKQQCYRARSAYKLLHIDDIFKIFNGVQRVVDLCNAPGSWSQVCRKKLGQKGFFNQNSNNPVVGERIVSVDLQQIAPIPNVHHIVSDITRKQTLHLILQAFNGNLSDLVICDGAPDITGFHDMDQYIQSQLLVAALNITLKILKNGGKFVAKIFKGSEIGYLYSQFKLYFREIHIVKPRSSRQSSGQHFIVGLDFQRERLIQSEILNVGLSTFFSQIEQQKMTKNQKQIFGFVTCGDLTDFDTILENIQEQEKTQIKELSQKKEDLVKLEEQKLKD